MNPNIKIASTGTGSTDGLASQILCKLNAVLFANYCGYQYIDIPFDDHLIKGNSGHRYGDYSTALQNIYFSFPGFNKINPLDDVYQKLKIIDLKDVHNKVDGLKEMRKFLNESIQSHFPEFEIFVLNGFSNLFSDKAYFYNKISRGSNLVIDPKYLDQSLLSPDKFKITVHIRRGDITTHEINFHRIIPMDYFNKVTDSVKKLLNSMGINYYINLHIEGNTEGFNHEHSLFKNTNPIASFSDILSSDLVISSKSSHSTVPVMLSGKLMIYPEDSWFAPLPGWIVANKDGLFETNKLNELLKSYYCSRI